jgi:hypothetical protein
MFSAPSSGAFLCFPQGVAQILPIDRHRTGSGFGSSGSMVPHLLHFNSSGKQYDLHFGHLIGFGFGGLQPPQYGLHDQHIRLPFVMIAEIS